MKNRAISISSGFMSDKRSNNIWFMYQAGQMIFYKNLEDGSYVIYNIHHSNAAFGIIITKTQFDECFIDINKWRNEKIDLLLY